MKRSILALAITACGLATFIHAAPPLVIPFDQVKAGMKGTGRTVFQGTQIETFQVEILGTLPRIGPDQNLILARLSGGPLAETGVLAGMSGSPIFIDDKLVGAVAYSWGFAKQAIAGITPIEEMLAAAARGDATTPRVKPRASLGPVDLRRLVSPDRLAAFLPSGLVAAWPGSPLASPLSLPTSVAGLGRDGLAKVMPELTRAGLLPVQGGGAGTSPAPSPPLEPGSAIGVKLTRGDLDITATGTVTWVDGNRVLAFGHPFFGLGSVDLPLTGARAEALLPTLDQSFRMATPLAEMGAFRQDRISGIFGEIGASSKMVPVRLKINSRGGTKEDFAFDVADDPLLTPVLVYVALNGILASKERIAGGVTLRLAEGSVIKVEGEDDIELDNLYTGPSAGMFATGVPAYVLYLMMNGDWEPPRIKGINLIFEYDSEPQSGRIRRVSLDRTRVRAGETVGVTIVLAPYRGQELVDTHEILIPPETPPGKLQLFVGDATDLERIEGADDGYLPIELHQLIKIVNQLRRNDRIYILATREDSGLILGGDRMPHLPPSMLTVLTRPRSQGNFVMVPRRAVLEEEIEAGFAVEGLSRLQIDVEAR